MNTKMKKDSLLALAGLAVLTSTWTQSVQAESWNMVFGLSQALVLKGGNVEVNYVTDRWVVEYSHGFQLDLNAGPDDLALTSTERAQGLRIVVPYSTGGGIGYRFTPALNVRVEFKQHAFEVNHPNQERIKYTTRDLGLGAYYFYHPINNSQLLIVPSLRYWPTISTSLPNDQHRFSNGDIHAAHDFGLFGNIAVGWRF